MSRRLRSQIRSCDRCALGAYSDSQEWLRVPWTGSKSNVAVIGEAPGKNEALKGEPFVGRAGKVLDRGLAEAGLSREEAFIFNVICCRPGGNDFTKAEAAGAVEACRPWFNRQLDLSGAWLVVLAGKRAYQAVMDEDVPLTWVRGKFQWFDGRLWLPTWHPAYVLRQGEGSEKAAEYWADWRGVGKVLRGEWEAPKPEKLRTGQMRLTVAQGAEARIRERLDLDGWVGLWSDVMGDYLVVVDDGRRPKPKVPAKWRRQPKWTLQELQMVNAGGKLSVTAEQLRRINLAKRTLGAKVVA
ncbi:MAG: uracil-DNA glycosylase family protein [Acidimicrobiia bacterium]